MFVQLTHLSSLFFCTYPCLTLSSLSPHSTVCTCPCLRLSSLSPHSTILYISLSHTQQSQSTLYSSVHIPVSHSAVSVHTLQFCTYPCLTLSSLSPHSTITNPHVFLPLTVTLLFLPASGRSVAVRHLFILHPKV